MSKTQINSTAALGAVLLSLAIVLMASQAVM